MGACLKPECLNNPRHQEHTLMMSYYNTDWTLRISRDVTVVEDCDIHAETTDRAALVYSVQHNLEEKSRLYWLFTGHFCISEEKALLQTCQRWNWLLCEFNQSHIVVWEHWRRHVVQYSSVQAWAELLERLCLLWWKLEFLMLRSAWAAGFLEFMRAPLLLILCLLMKRLIRG